MDWKQKYHSEAHTIDDHSHNLIHELSRRLNCLSRYEEYIADSGGHPEVQEFWRDSKRQQQASIDQLTRLIRNHVNFDRIG
jgi:hypothetical protein